MASDLEVAQQTQEKFQFYAVALNFTLLAAAIQTAEFGVYVLQDWFELVGWACLACAGIVGLSKLEWSAFIRVKHARKAEIEDSAEKLRQLQAQGMLEAPLDQSGHMQRLVERLQNHERALAQIANQLESIKARDAAKYTVAKWSFLLGILAVISARGCAALANLLGYDLLRAA